MFKQLRFAVMALITLIGLAFPGVSPCFARGTVSPVVDFQSARTLGLAGAGKGKPTLTDSIFLNPSGLALEEIQAISATYDWLNHVEPAVGSTNQRVLNASIIDGRNPYVAGGLAYTRRPDLDIIHAAIGKKVLDWMAVGLSGKRYTTRPSFADIAGSNTGYDLGVSLTFAPNAELMPVPFSIAIVGDNLVRHPGNEPYIGGRKAGVGARISLKDILYLYGDVTRTMRIVGDDWSSVNVASELSIGGGLFARGGVMMGARKGWGIGGSWMAPRIGLNYGYQKRTGPRDGYEHAATIDLYM